MCLKQNLGGKDFPFWRLHENGIRSFEINVTTEFHADLGDVVKMLDVTKKSPIPQPSPRALLAKIQRMKMQKDIANPKHISWLSY